MDARLRDLIARAAATDGNPPFSDGALVEFAHGDRELLWLGEAAALATATSAEFVVDPDARGHGLGARMLDLLLARGDELFWAHGDHPASRALARARRLEPVRTLLHLRAPVPTSPTPRVEPVETSAEISLPGRLGRHAASGAPGPAAVGPRPQTAYSISGFDLADADAWLELNARAFAAHPEQGKMTRADLDTTMAEPWFDADDFLLVKDGGQLIGFTWLKENEFYAVGVDPDRQGEGLGRQLVEAGFARLREHGIRSAHLYVEGDNAPALRLYRAYGFTQDSIDIQYKLITDR